MNIVTLVVAGIVEILISEFEQTSQLRERAVSFSDPRLSAHGPENDFNA